MSDSEDSSLALIGRQRSHLLVVLSQAVADREAAFLSWYQGTYFQAIAKSGKVLRVQHYEQHPVDIGRGQYPLLPFRFLGLYELSLDGAQAADPLIERIGNLHREHPAAEDAATWLYYAVSEKVGRSPDRSPSMLTLAFANAVPGQDDEFREFYATRHIRHALYIPALVSGQCFARTRFQKPGALDARFSMVAVYEQTGTPESIIESFGSLPEGTFDFPTMDISRFAESVYQPL